MTAKAGDRAVVLGASMAGLLAARVLADAYDEVCIVDRDVVRGVVGARRGVPQGRHVHGLLARGQRILDELFPGFTEHAMAAGVPTGDLGELRWFFNGRRLSPGRTGLTCVSAARPVLEAMVRDRVTEMTAIRLLDGHGIESLCLDEGNRRVTGARLRREADGEIVELPADLVVDATGRGSRTPVWLADWGYERPAEERVAIGLSYTTRRYRLRDERILGGDLSINPVSSPSHPRGAFFSRIENGQCMVSLTGVLGDSAPTDPDGFLEFAKSLPVPDVYDVLREAEPLDEPVLFRYPASIRRRYDRLSRFPAAMIVLGDAACSFNPVYGQGMTVAAMEALVLRDSLRQDGGPAAAGFHRSIARVIDLAWNISASGDLGFPGVPGPRPLKVRVGNAYLARLQAAAVRSGAVTRTFMRVAGLVDPPQALMYPGTVMRVLRYGSRVPSPGSAVATVATQ